MSKETNKLIPDLRFPEFVNEGEWDEKSIGDVFNSFSGGTPNTSEKEYYGGEIPFIRSAEINKEETELFLTNEGLKNSSAKLVNKGDLLVALYGANSGDSAISKINGAINQAILCLQSEFSNSFTYNFLTFKKDWIVSRFIQGGQGNLSGDIIKSLSIPFPKPEEQHKIASCLSSLDEVITAHSQKLELLKDHKKGLMQNLFPQEGEKVPRLRFKEFENDGEWEEKTIDDVFNSFSGGTPSTSEEEYYGGEIPFIRSAEINKEETELFLTEEGLKNSSAKLVNKGDLLVALYGANSGDSAISKINGAINQAILCLQSEFSNSFTYNFLTFKKEWIVSRFIQGGQGNLSGDIIKSLSIPFPKPNEQQKIASCLSSLDDLITAQAEEIEQLKLHKKGLMQGLFPGSV